MQFKAVRGAVPPEYESLGAAGADIRASLDEPMVLQPGCTGVVPTGLFFSIPNGYEVQVRPRSGIAAKNGVTVLNSPGTIDSDYRGEVKVLLINLGNQPFAINNGDRIAQIVVAPVTRSLFIESDVLDETERGAGGFGSTGVAT
ncbi:MAG: dUTP diphosphatase [Treponemataceae bacterium]|nr:dUTP diphosphatase [Treponemataceae bacterium]